ncbi:hypothetical protein KCP91_15545 [Microvirga sp. SRT01]|uniref:Uncharacterized protein n=1 Tax=Sphingomonas longa TaxID=2778730 RepID=A0ABS2DA21_9SPHN|nr:MULTISPECIES: hypothetical protein [Alphaproteobacteria]MBM6577797.1 hypothetical protein [Sphingomonas sp. BT552]MBR7710839.1 hypothetical protein [Microvirga sp. SRT01]
MTEATWNEASKTPEIDWRMSAALENVPRGETDVADVTSLEGAVRVWLELDPQHRVNATLTPERPIFIDGAAHSTFVGEGVDLIAQLLPTKQTEA